MASSVTSFPVRDNPRMDAAEIQSHIAQLLPSLASEEITDVTYLEGGYSNQNYAFTLGDQRLVIRVPRRRQPFVDRGHEARFIEQLPDNLAPECLALDPASGRMISRWVDGDLLIERADELTPAQLINYLHTLHAQLPDPDRVYCVDTLVASYAGKTPNDPPSPSAHSGPCHNDLNPWNIIVTPGGWVTLDWEFVGHNDPLFDLVALHQGLARPNTELTGLAAALLPDTVVLDQRLNAAFIQFWRREEAWADYQLKQGNVRPEITRQATIARDKLKSFVPF